MRRQKRKANAKYSLAVSIAAIIIVLIASLLEYSGVTDILGSSSSPAVTASQTTDTTVPPLMTAHFIDVGQGDSTLFVSDGETMLVDCGESEYGETVMQYLTANSVTHLDYFVISHAHSDHMGSAADIIEKISIDNIIISQPSESAMGKKIYGELLDAINDCEAEIIMAEPDYTFTLGDAECTILAPFSVSEEENNNSVIIYITAGKTSFLMTGDAEKAVEKELINAYPDLSVTVLKAGHHGSKSSSHKNFIEHIGARDAVISVGADNDYGHPTEQVLTTFEENGIRVFRTDLNGTVKITCYKDSYKVSTEK